jgi:hypothetical protein
MIILGGGGEAGERRASPFLVWGLDPTPICPPLPNEIILRRAGRLAPHDRDHVVTAARNVLAC